MSTVIREKRKATFSQLRITTQNIRAIASLIEEEVNVLKVNQGECYVNFLLDSHDGAAYESQSVIIYADNKIFEKKGAGKVVMNFRTIDYSKNIDISILDSIEKDDNNNFFTVSGDDPTWVNGIFERIATIIDSTETQPKHLNKLRWFNIISWIVIFFSAANFYNEIQPKIRNDYFDLLALVLVLIGIPGLGFWIAHQISRCYPAVELQTGPEHFQKAKIMRKRIGALLSLVVIPLMLAITYDLLKSGLGQFR